MSLWEWGLIGLLAFVAVQQLAATGLFLLRSRPQDSPKEGTSPASPPALVISPARGTDDRLRETCCGLRSQAYPRMSVPLILDGPGKTIEPLLKEELGDDPRFEMLPLTSGSLAVQKTVLEEQALWELWAMCGCADLHLSSHLRKSGRALKCPLQLLMVERSSCSVAGSRRFVGRQMLWTPLYRPDAFWPVGVLYLNLAISLCGLTGFAIRRFPRGNS